METLTSLGLGAVALYGLGLPLAWLFPAPEKSPWAFRVAIAPLYAIALATIGATLLRVVGMALHPAQLATLMVIAWLAAWARTRHRWGLRGAVRAATGPVVVVAFASLTWLSSLVDYGLYLPNRDFKNHAFWVAQVAFNHSADPSLVLRASSLAPPSQGAFYPIGLHTLLGWALPSPGWNSIGVTAAAAVLITAISTPLGLIALARMWAPGSTALWWLAGFAAACFPGLTGTFGFGSVTILAATALYPAGLAMLWLWLREPHRGTTFALLTVAFGLFALHIAEAMALALVAALALPVAHWPRIARFRPTHWWVLVVATAAAVVLVAAILARLGRLETVAELVGGIQRDDISPTPIPLGVFVGQPGGLAVMAVLWPLCVAVGTWMAVRARWSAFPLVALFVPWALVVLATAGWVPDVLRLLTAPWYAQSGRITLLATPAIALLGCLPLAGSISADGLAIQRRLLHRVPSWLAVLLCAAIMLGIVSPLVPDRRRDLAASLAGAGDTPLIAAALAARLQPGQTVLNFEGDGTANLFALRRIPVVSGWAQPDTQPAGAHDVAWLMANLMNVAEPEVAEAMADLGVGYLALGTTSMYWDPGTGYDLARLVAQPEFTTELVGSDMVVLRYTPGAS